MTIFGRDELLEKLYQLKPKSPLDVALEEFDTLSAPPLFDMIHPKAVPDIYYIVTNPAYTFDEKDKRVSAIMEEFGFYKFHAGTNRNVYAHRDYTTITIKIAMDEQCMEDSVKEWKNQFKLRPFVTKVFEVDPTGVIGVFERVKPILSREHFYTLADQIFDMLVTRIIGKYVLDDIGSKAFMNYGLRDGFGPVLLDFPYCYELDHAKMTCKEILDNGKECKGVVDYDDGFNQLQCTKCGKHFKASQLSKLIMEKRIDIEDNNIFKMKGENGMRIRLSYGQEPIMTIDTEKFGSERYTKGAIKRERKKKVNVDYSSIKPYSISYGDEYDTTSQNQNVDIREDNNSSNFMDIINPFNTEIIYEENDTNPEELMDQTEMAQEKEIQALVTDKSSIYVDNNTTLKELIDTIDEILYDYRLDNIKLKEDDVELINTYKDNEIAKNAIEEKFAQYQMSLDNLEQYLDSDDIDDDVEDSSTSIESPYSFTNKEEEDFFNNIILISNKIRNNETIDPSLLGRYFLYKVNHEESFNSLKSQFSEMFDLIESHNLDDADNEESYVQYNQSDVDYMDQVEKINRYKKSNPPKQKVKPKISSSLTDDEYSDKL